MNRTGIYAENAEGVCTTTIVAPKVNTQNLDDYLPELRFTADYTASDGTPHNEVVVIALSKTGIVDLCSALAAILQTQNARRLRDRASQQRAVLEAAE